MKKKEILQTQWVQLQRQLSCCIKEEDDDTVLVVLDVVIDDSVLVAISN